MDLPRIVITGASGFLGRHLLSALKETHRIHAMARRPPEATGAPRHAHIAWHQVDVAEPEPLTTAFRDIALQGGADVLVHLAAHYDFTGQETPDYWRTNVDGLRNVLELSRLLRLRRFVYASSVAASRFPPRGKALDERSPPDGDHVYCATKRIGEAMLDEYRGHFPSSVVRLAALFSDWCEYPPLFVLLGTWLSGSWNRRMLGGRGESAIPYLHVADAVSFLRRVIDPARPAAPKEVLIASPDGAVSQRELFEASTAVHRGRRVAPVFVPKPFSRLGLHTMDVFGRLAGERPFLRPWMGRYIDLRMDVDASRSRALTGWSPNPRLTIIRRMPFLIDHFKVDPADWHRRNWAALRTLRLTANLRLYQILEAREEEIVAVSLSRFLGREALTRFPHYLDLSTEDLSWSVSQVCRHLKSAVRTRENALFRAYCRDLAKRRIRQGFTCAEVCDALAMEAECCREVLRKDPRFDGLEEAHELHVEMTFRFGIDEVEDCFEERAGGYLPGGTPGDPA